MFLGHQKNETSEIIYNGNTSQIEQLEALSIRQTKPAKLASRSRTADARLKQIFFPPLDVD